MCSKQKKLTSQELKGFAAVLRDLSDSFTVLAAWAHGCLLGLREQRQEEEGTKAAGEGPPSATTAEVSDSFDGGGAGGGAGEVGETAAPPTAFPSAKAAAGGSWGVVGPDIQLPWYSKEERRALVAALQSPHIHLLFQQLLRFIDLMEASLLPLVQYDLTLVAAAWLERYVLV